MKTFNSIIVFTLLCLLMLTAACGKKSIRGVSGGEALFSGEDNHEVAGHDQDFSDDLLVQLGETPMGEDGDARGDDKGATMSDGGKQGLTNDGDFSSAPSVQPEESSLGNGRDVGAVEALSAVDLYDDTGGTVLAREGQKGSSSIFSTSTRSGASGSDGEVSGMENSKGQSGTLPRDPFAASGPSSGISAAQEESAWRNGAYVSQELRDVFFAYDSWQLSEQSHQILESNAEWLKAHPHARVTIEGHCDERGTRAYNYVLGERRTETVKQYLSHLGIPPPQMAVVSFGKDRPVCHVFSTACFQANRRTHFSIDVNMASRD